jgi:hypothetical protein
MQVLKKAGLFVFAIACGGCLVLWASNHRGEPAPAPAADPLQECRNVLTRSGIANATLHVTGELSWYDETNPENSRQQTTFECVRNSSTFFSKVGAQTVFSDGKNVVQLDNDNRMVIVAKNRVDISMSPEAGAQLLSRMLEDTAQGKLHVAFSSDDGQPVLTLESESIPQMQNCKLYYDASTYALKRVLIRSWREKAPAETFGSNVIVTDIRYRFQSYHGFEKDQTMESVAEINGTNIQLAPKYKAYQLQTLL